MLWHDAGNNMEHLAEMGQLTATDICDKVKEYLPRGIARVCKSTMCKA